jgi:hypothetical protein
MKRLIKSVVVLCGLFFSSAMADDYDFNIDSLVAFEGGYSKFDIEKNEPGKAAIIDKKNVGEIGVKIGAQSQNYRLFLSGRYYSASDTNVASYDYVITVGAEVQYLFNFSRYANLFLGVNAGLVNSRFTPTGEPTSRTISDPYVGGDIGFNFHVSKDFDLEIGGRVMASDAENTQIISGNKITYKFDNIATAYTSLIFKFQMD